MIAGVVFAALCLLSCAQGPKPVESTVPAASGASTVVTAPNGSEAGSVDNNRLAEPVFRTLPVEAREYLERLSRAFGSRDEAFLLAQGEAQFETEVRPRVDNETYFALLYRIGLYAAESPRTDVRPPRVSPSAISHIQYLSWEENGPLLEIKARLMGTDGKNIPCLIMLVWRLREPKIEGLFL